MTPLGVVTSIPKTEASRTGPRQTGKSLATSPMVLSAVFADIASLSRASRCRHDVTVVAASQICPPPYFRLARSVTMSETQADTTGPAQAPKPLRGAPRCFTARIILIDKVHFRLDPAGELAQIAAIRDRYDWLEDLVAWMADTPGSWHVKEGTCPVLGARELHLAAAWGDPVMIYPTPSAWVGANGAGVCVLDWGAELLGCFEGVPEISTAHLPVDTAKAIEKRLKQNFWRGLPRVGGRRGR